MTCIEYINYTPVRYTEVTQMTLRDEVWNEVLVHLHKKESLKRSDLHFDSSQRHTVRRVLNRMENHGWLYRDSPNCAIWKRGEKFETLLKDSE